MKNRIGTQVSEEIEAIDCLRARLDSADPPSALEIDQALEQGFGRLMALKARLRELRAEDSQGSPPNHETIDEMDDCVSQLAASLTALRVHTGPNRGARIGYGFVLPERRVRKPTHG